MDTDIIVKSKDNDKQYAIYLSTVTYQIIVDNMMEFSPGMGLQLTRDDVDDAGSHVQAQFLLMLAHDDEVRKFPVVITCYHTTNKILIN